MPAIRTAVITGRHPFDVIGFHELFRILPGIDPYIQHMEDFVSSPPEIRQQYDTVVFYHFHQETPGSETQWWEAGLKPALETLGETAQGIVVLHHAILAFPLWDFWAELVGIEDRGFTYHIGETLTLDVTNPTHPITRGLPASWTMVDETYGMNSPGPDSEVLVTTTHQPSMTALAWTRTFKKAPVFCLESGHDNRTWVDPNFRRLLTQGIHWTAGREGA